MTVNKNEQATSLQFTFQGNHQIQTILLNDEPYFVAKDVCKILGISNSRDAMSRLDEDEKLQSVIPTSGQNRKVNIVSESGLYALIFQSRKPNAKQFRKWVTSEVLPALRKTGKYEMPKTKPLSQNNKYQKQKVETYLSLNDVELLKQACKKLEYKSIYELLQQLIYNFLNGNTTLFEMKRLQNENKKLRNRSVQPSLLLYSYCKAFNMFLEEELNGHCGTELRLSENIKAARNLFPEERKQLLNAFKIPGIS